VHDVFFVNLLEPYQKSKNPLHTIIQAEPEEIDNEESWLIKGIVESRTVGRKKKVEYRVQWKGFRIEDGQWEPYENLTGTAKEALKEFQKQYPRKPRNSWVSL
jgi:hypothetical protein